MKKITLFFINWNDSFYLPFIKKHYGQFCQRIVMFDNHSTDNSRNIAIELGFEVRLFGMKGVLDDQHYLDVKNNCWKEERGNADYVIVCDADEFLVIDDLQGNIPVVHGYNMISDRLPVESIFEINTGTPSENYSKQIIFKPEAVQEINFVHGCHKNHLIGIRSLGNGHCRLIHYRQIGGLIRMLERHALYRPRLSPFNKKHNMGIHYGKPEWTKEMIDSHNEQKRLEWEELKSKAIELW